MKKVIILLFAAFFSHSKINAQFADFDIAILTMPGTIGLNTTGILNVVSCNNGSTPIVANSLRIVISVGTNAEILGVQGGSDPRYTVESLTPGTNNTIRLTNTGGTIGALSCATINLLVRGNVVGGPSTITGTISYITIVGGNPLLGGVFPNHPPNSSQGNTTTNNDNSTTSLTVSLVLPITLTDFKGVLQNKQVLLTWKTSAEVNSSHFDVQRSKDGINFETIGTVAAKGNSTVDNNYQLIDMNPVKGINFYRLKPVYIDGKFGFSSVITIKLGEGVKGSITLNTNPARGDIRLNFTGMENGNYKVVLTSLSGTVQLTDQVKISTIAEQKIIKVPATVAKGLYVIQVYQNGANRISTIKVLIE